MTNKTLMKNLTLLFNAVIVDDTTQMVDFNRAYTLQHKAMQYGYIVPIEACTEDMFDFIKLIDVINPNATFYKEWSDVTERTRFQLLFDQLIHYATTYGTNFTWGNGFTRNEDYPDITEFNLTNHKVIRAVTHDEMFKMCVDMLNSGIALKQDTMEIVVTYVVKYLKNNYIEDFDVDTIKNREARVKLYDLLGIFPNDKFELIRYIVYKATGLSTIIKNRTMLQTIRMNARKVDFQKLTEKQCISLASIFFRYKDILLMFKTPQNAPVINKIRRLANKYHKPMVAGMWETLTTGKYDVETVYTQSAELTNYKLITLIQMLKERCVTSKDSPVVYTIRNGKQFVKSTNTINVTPSLLATYTQYISVLERRLIENLSKKACPVRLDDNIVLTCPTSEKNFIGNIPMGTYVDFANNDNIIGVYWRNEWGAHDFDLSMNNIHGQRIGWNASYYDFERSNVVYSGDMTNADPEACELLYMSENVVPGTVYLNRYSGCENSKYKLFIAQEKIATYQQCKNYMCDPNSIKFECMGVSKDSRQTTLGFIANNKFYFIEKSSGNDHVARNSHIAQQDMFNLTVRKAESMVYLRDILMKSGFTIVDDTYTGDDVLDLRVKNLTVDSLITLFNKNV